MAGLRLKIDPTGMTSGGKKAEEALDGVKKKAGGASDATSKTGQAFNKTGKEASDASPRVNRLGGEFRSMGGMAAKAGAALLALGATLAAGMSFQRFVDATVKSDNAQAQLASAIASTGGAAGRSAEQLNDHASALQRVTNFGDESTSAMQALLLTFTNVQGVTFDRATVAIQDVATAMKKDLSSAALQVGKALNDPVLGMTALSESGIQFTEAQKDMVKAMVEVNDIAGAQNIVLNELEKQFGGSAEAARNTLGGALKSLGDAWGDVFEIGSEASDGLRLAVEGLIETVSDPRFVSSIRSIGAAMFSAAEMGVRALSLLVDNIDFLVISVGVLAASSLHGAIIGLYGLTTGLGVATVASGALAFAMNAIPLVAIATGITLLYRAYNSQGEAVDLATEAQERLRTELGLLNVSTETGIQDSRDMAKARLDEAKATLAAAEAALQLFQTESTLSGRNRRPREQALLRDVEAQAQALAGVSAEVAALEERIAESAGDAANTSRELTNAIASQSKATYSAIPALSELREEYGALAETILAVMEAQNELAVADFNSMIDGLADSTAGAESLATALDVDKLNIFANEIRAVGQLDSFAEQAIKLQDMARYVFEASNGVAGMGGPTRILYEQILAASTEATNLAIASGQISFAAATSSAAQLAAKLGIAVAAASRLMSMPSFTAGRGSGGEVLFDPRDPRYHANVAARERQRLNALSAPITSGRTSAGPSASVDQTRAAYDSLMASLDPVIAATQRLTVAQATINEAMEAGHITATDAARAYGLAQEAFDKNVASIGEASNVWKSFESAGASAIDRLIEGTGDLRDVLLDVIKQMALAIANKNIIASGGSAVSSIGGLIMNAFSGFFDEGGTIPMGSTGIVGEHGMEKVKATPSGALVTSRVQTAKQMGGGQRSGTVINIDARGAQEGVAAQIAQAIQQAAPAIMGGAVKTVEQNFGGYQREYAVSGAMV